MLLLVFLARGAVYLQQPEQRLNQATDVTGRAFQVLSE